MAAAWNRLLQHFNPPTPWGVGQRVRDADAGLHHFNPPTPWGVGPAAVMVRSAKLKFQSTHSVGSGTYLTYDEYVAMGDFNPPTP